MTKEVISFVGVKLVQKFKQNVTRRLEFKDTYYFTFSGSSPPGMTVPSLEQKQ